MASDEALSKLLTSYVQISLKATSGEIIHSGNRANNNLFINHLAIRAGAFAFVRLYQRANGVFLQYKPRLNPYLALGSN